MNCVINARIYDFVSLKENAYILFDETIREIGDMSTLPIGDYEVIDAAGRLVMPGLSCAHTHFYSLFARGLNVPFHPANFQEILDQLWWKLDRHLDLEMVFHSALAQGLEMIENGVTTVIDHHASGAINGSLNEIKKAINDFLGMRGIFAFETSDRFNIDDCILENNDFISKNHSLFTSGLFGLHASMSLSDETLARVRDESTAPMHIHVGESLMDEELCMKRHNLKVVARLDKFNLLRKDSLLVHCTHVDEEELSILQKKEVSIVVNVSSNMNNGVGLPDVRRFLKRKIPVLIGNDGLSPAMTSEYLALYYSMHLKYNDPLAFSLEDLREIILNNYEYVSRRFGQPIGRIEKGYAADLLIIPYHPITKMDRSNAFSHVFFGMFHAFKPRDVFIQGKRVLNNYKHHNDLNLILEKTKDVSRRCHESIEKEDLL